jgi:hypothetical protein
MAIDLMKSGSTQNSFQLGVVGCTYITRITETENNIFVLNYIIYEYYHILQIVYHN